MSRTITGASMLALAVALAASGQPARANGNDTGEQERAQGEQIVVTGRRAEGFSATDQQTATKTPLDLQETPQAVSVITRELLDARFLRDQSAALEQAAGVTVSGGPGPFAGRPGRFAQRIIFRGVTLDGEAGTREDGFAVRSDRYSPDLAVYERIEAVKGPASVLYGQGEAGGFLNRVRKLPTDVPNYEVSALGGSFGVLRAEADLGGGLTEGISGRVVAAYEQGDSFVDEVESNVFVIAPSVNARLGDTTNLLVHFSYQRDRHVPNPGTPLIEVDGEFVRPDLPFRQFNAVAPDVDLNGNDVYVATAQLDQEVGDDWLATLRLNYNNIDSRSFEDRYGFAYLDGGDTFIYSSVDNSAAETLSGELRIGGKIGVFSEEDHLLIGADGVIDREDRQFSYNYLGIGNFRNADFGTFPALRPEEIQDNLRDTLFDRRALGLYAQTILSPAQGLKVIVGGRVDFYEQSLEDNLTGDILSEQSGSAFTGRVGAVYEITDSINAYGTIAQSFIPTTARDVNDNILAPVEGLIYEVGAKGEWLDGRLTLTASLFRLDRDNVPIPDPGNPRFNISAGTQRNQGLELELNGEPVPGWNLSVAATALDAEYIEQDDPNFGNRPRFTTPWQASFFSTYEVQDGPLKGLGFGGGLFTIGERAVLDNNDARAAGHTRVDATLFYNGFENIELGVFVRNLFDARYIESPIFDVRLSQLGAPASVLFRIKTRL
ncbi:TonB-dependent siderophore receptor [Erythrobacter sp. W302b]|uniref:TonB-dependent siderophore receptor n=1 Tax=Erythrobacter sp. W302b TaxID=3389874 RepID=UPI00396B3FF3